MSRKGFLREMYEEVFKDNAGYRAVRLKLYLAAALLVTLICCLVTDTPPIYWLWTVPIALVIRHRREAAKRRRKTPRHY